MTVSNETDNVPAKNTLIAAFDKALLLGARMTIGSARAVTKFAGKCFDFAPLTTLAMGGAVFSLGFFVGMSALYGAVLGSAYGVSAGFISGTVKIGGYATAGAVVIDTFNKVTRRAVKLYQDHHKNERRKKLFGKHSGTDQ